MQMVSYCFLSAACVIADPASSQQLCHMAHVTCFLCSDSTLLEWHCGLAAFHTCHMTFTASLHSEAEISVAPPVMQLLCHGMLCLATPGPLTE